MITKVKSYNSKEQLQIIEFHNGVEEFAESYSYYSNKSEYEVEMANNSFKVLKNDKVWFEYFIIDKDLEEYEGL